MKACSLINKFFHIPRGGKKVKELLTHASEAYGFFFILGMREE